MFCFTLVLCTCTLQYLHETFRQFLRANTWFYAQMQDYIGRLQKSGGHKFDLISSLLNEFS